MAMHLDRSPDDFVRKLVVRMFVCGTHSSPPWIHALVVAMNLVRPLGASVPLCLCVVPERRSTSVPPYLGVVREPRSNPRRLGASVSSLNLVQPLGASVPRCRPRTSFSPSAPLCLRVVPEPRSTSVPPYLGVVREPRSNPRRLGASVSSLNLVQPLGASVPPCR